MLLIAVFQQREDTSIKIQTKIIELSGLQVILVLSTELIT